MGSEWRTVSFGQLIEAGALEIGDGYRAKNSELGGDGPIFLRAGHVRDTHIDLDGVDRFHRNLERAVASKMSAPGDVIVTTKGNSTGRVAFIDDRISPVVYSPHLSYWRSLHRSILVPGFLRYWSRSVEFHNQLSGLASSTDMAPYLSLVDQKRLRITLPPPAEQERIARVLGALDDKIELNRRMSQTLESMARTLFKSWFVDFDPVRAKAEGRDPGLPRSLARLFPDSLWDSDLGEVPDGWTIATFTETVDVVGGGTPKTAVADYWNGDIPWFSIADAPKDTDLWVVDTEKKITHAGLENSSTRILPAGTTIVTARGTVGRVAMVGTPMAMNQSCYGLQGKPGRREYFTFFSTRHLVSALRQRAHGSVFDTITRDSLAGVSITLPSPEIVDAFEAAVDPILLKARAGVLESQPLQTTRDALLVHLLAGPSQGAAHLQSLDGGIA